MYQFYYNVRAVICSKLDTLIITAIMHYPHCL